MFQSVRRLSPDVYECWEFAHPRATTSGCDNGHNVRSAEMVFTIPEAGILQYVFLSFLPMFVHKHMIQWIRRLL